MKIFHLSDLHIGKMLNGYRLKENQEAVFAQITEAARRERPDAILICGDIYDKSSPSGEAIGLFDHFLKELGAIRPRIPVLIIAGNHDSPERLRFASSFLEKQHIIISSLPPQKKEERLKKITLTDEYGAVNFYLLPFTRPGMLRKLMEEEGEKAGEGENAEQEKNGLEKGSDYEKAVKWILDREQINRRERNVLLSHQFYISGKEQPETCDSELLPSIAGGLDSIDIRVLEAFDYVALGHLHGAQKAGKDHIRYCGSPYKYSVSEEHQKKAIDVITLGEKGKPAILERIPLKGLWDVRREKGTLEEILKRAGEGGCHDFVSVILTDEKESYNFREKLEEVYDHLIEIQIENERMKRALEDFKEEIKEAGPLEAFEEFYRLVRGLPLKEEERRIMEEIILREKEDEDQ